MDKKKIGIFYGTRYGATQGVAEFISQKLIEKSFQLVVINLKENSQLTNMEIDDFDGIIIGSGIKIGQMTSEVLKFIEENQNFIQNPSKISGIFVCAGMVKSQETREVAERDFLQPIFTKYQFQPSVFQAFGGLLDFSNTSKVGFLMKKLLKMVIKQEKDEAVDLNGFNDRRNWVKIEDFTDQFTNLF